jgi:arabinofuranosyltransferase
VIGTARTVRVLGRRGWELGVPVGVLAIAAWRRRWIAEDAFINLRVVDVTRRGGPPFAFNRGERVEASTSPLWVATLVGLDVALGRFVRLERLALGAGLGLSLLGLSAATGASARLVRQAGAGRSWPAGALVLSVLPPVWDFATSGLETGMTLGWLGGCEWLLARRHAAAGVAPSRGGPGAAWLPVVLGLGPLIRPDLSLFSAAFVTALLALDRPHRTVATVTSALAAPAAYQLFRMMHFAATVPNPALAKEAGAREPARGLAYLHNHVRPYHLALPAALVAGWAGTWLARSGRGGARIAVLAGAPAVGAVLHGAYVVRVGGDFMHSRLLLPATYGLFTAAAALPLEFVGRAIPTVLTAWAATCALRLRLPDRPSVRWRDIVDERAWWRRESGRRNPVTIEDYHLVASARTGMRARALAARGADVLVRIDGREHALAPGSGVVLEAVTIGVASFAAGPDVRVIDVLGLADPVGSRMPADPAARTGHQKRLPLPLVLARVTFAGEHDAEAGGPTEVEPARLEAARRLLRQPALATLLAATGDPLTVRRALRNLRLAVALTRFRFSVDTVTGSPAPQDVASARTSKDSSIQRA